MGGVEGIRGRGQNYTVWPIIPETHRSVLHYSVSGATTASCKVTSVNCKGVLESKTAVFFLLFIRRVKKLRLVGKLSTLLKGFFLGGGGLEMQQNTVHVARCHLLCHKS